MSSSWKSVPFVIAHPSIFSKSDLDRFEADILYNPMATEHDASRFFEAYPKFLYLGQGQEIRREAVLLGADGRPNSRVDFFRKSYGTEAWDIVELKHPHHPIVVGAKSNHPRLSSDVVKAMNQAQDYRDKIIENAHLRAQLLKKGILVYRPQILIIAGQLDENTTLELMAGLRDRVRSSGPIDLLSYSDIFRFAKEHYESNKVFFTIGHTISFSSDVIRPDQFAFGISGLFADLYSAVETVGIDLQQNNYQRTVLAQRAVNLTFDVKEYLIPRRGRLFVGNGTTPYFIARELFKQHNGSDLQIVTSNLEIAIFASVTRQGLNLHLIPGSISPQYAKTIPSDDRLQSLSLRETVFDVAVISISQASIDGRFFSHNAEQVNSILQSVKNRVIIVADSKKLDHASHFAGAELRFPQAVGIYLVTDNQPTSQAIRDKVSVIVIQ